MKRKKRRKEKREEKKKEKRKIRCHQVSGRSFGRSHWRQRSAVLFIVLTMNRRSCFRFSHPQRRRTRRALWTGSDIKRRGETGLAVLITRLFFCSAKGIHFFDFLVLVILFFLDDLALPGCRPWCRCRRGLSRGQIAIRGLVGSHTTRHHEIGRVNHRALKGRPFSSGKHKTRRRGTEKRRRRRFIEGRRHFPRGFGQITESIIIKIIIIPSDEADITGEFGRRTRGRGEHLE